MTVRTVRVEKDFDETVRTKMRELGAVAVTTEYGKGAFKVIVEFSEITCRGTGKTLSEAYWDLLGDVAQNRGVT